MTYYNHNRLIAQTNRRHYMQRLRAGCDAVLRHKGRLLLLSLHLFALGILWVSRGCLARATVPEIFVPMLRSLYGLTIALYAPVSTIGLLVLWGGPLRAWQNQCTMCFDEDSLIPVLQDLVHTLEARKALLRETDCANIGQYHAKLGQRLPHILFFCDEVTELLEKTGISKAQKEKVLEIEGMLCTIARLGRAFGISLILATQRPSVDTINGNIRNNCMKICGQADSNLSMVILGNTSAADLIPKNVRGRFLMEDGTVFQGYYMDSTQTGDA